MAGEVDFRFSAAAVEGECRRAGRRGNAGATAQLCAELLDADHDRASDLASRHPRDLSAGERLCLALAIQLTARPRVLLIDEPSEGLAPVLIEHMMEAIRQLSASTTVLLVEQNFQVASQLAERYVIIEEGISVHLSLIHI
mgnify:CR=1 FL=1